MRSSGILLPIFSIPSKYGIGTFGQSAYEFIDFLEQAGQKYWQILPLGPTGYGDSPYQSFSTFAGNPYFIDLELLIEEGYLTEEDVNKYDFGADVQRIDYKKLYDSRFLVLRLAYHNADLKGNFNFTNFCKNNQYWLEDYSIYMTIKDKHHGVSWHEWPKGFRERDSFTLEEFNQNNQDTIVFYQFIQYLFYQQWQALKDYANEKGIKIIGDIPIYVAYDSADTWASPILFQLDENLLPKDVAGCPPDAFSPTGQLWGNPLYDWDYHKRTGYQWWIHRLNHCFNLYDVVRIDHFRGFDEYYSIPFHHLTAEHGRWLKGPGYDFFQKVREAIGDKPVIAEDLGYLTDSVIELVKSTGYPGMKVLQFAFDSREESDYLPHNYDKNCVVYTGTHDNDTVLGWFTTLNSTDKQYLIEYLDLTTEKDVSWCLIRTAYASVADTVIIPIQDYLSLGSQARINIPSTIGENWRWRLLKNQCDAPLAQKILNLTRIFKRR